MTDLEKLLAHSLQQTLALAKATGALVEACRQLDAAARTIQTLQGEIECLQLDLAEAKMGRGVRQ